MQTGGLAVDTGIDTRVFTSAGRAEIAKEQRELGKNTKGVAAITGTAGLAVPSIAAGLLDKGNSNPDSFNKSGIDKAKNNVTQLVNNLETGMSDDTVNLAATVESIQEGELTNSIDNKDTLNDFNTAITKGTDAEGTQISLVEDLRNVEGSRVQGTTNVNNQTDTYLSTDSMGNVVEVINHEAAHQNGQGEAAADVMGKTGNSAFNLGKWANSGAIAEERTTIKPRPITAANDAQAQQEQLASDKEKLEAQQDAGDAFENDDYSQRNGRWGNSADHALYNKANKEYKNNKTKQDQFISGYRSAEGDAFIAPVKDAMSAVAHPIQTVTSLYDMLKSPIDSTVAIAISAKDWYTVYNAAKINDPRLYGQMKAQLDANLGFTGATVIIGGSAVNAIKVSRVASKLNTNAIKDANKANKNNPPHVSVGDEPYVAPKNTTGNFQTHGITLKDVPKSVQKAMMDDIKASGNSNSAQTLREFVESGKTVPVPMIANKNTKLYKLVSTTGDYDTPSPNTGYWIDQKQYNLVKAHPDRANDILGLPKNSQASSFNVFEMQPKPGKKPRIYQSSIATTTNPSGLTNVGNATQTLVPNRKLWSEPKKTKDVIKVK